MSETIDRMKLDLELRGRSPLTIYAYLRTARALEQFHGKAAADLGEADVRAYLRHVIEQAKEAPQSLHVRVAALRTLFGITLGRPEVTATLAYQKKPKRLPPHIITQADIHALLHAAESVRLRCWIMAGYGGGLRVRHQTAHHAQCNSHGRHGCRLQAGEVLAGNHQRHRVCRPVLLQRRHADTGAARRIGETSRHSPLRGV